MIKLPQVLVIHGPNLNLLGIREPNTYGAVSLEQINERLMASAQKAGFVLDCVQSNSEALLIDAVHQAFTDKVNYIIINPAALSHTSIALRDALAAVAIPFIEVHLSNIYAREPFRHHSYFSDCARGVISGLGWKGYLYALKTIIEELNVESVSWTFEKSKN